MGVKDATPHGVSSAFRDWAVDCTSFADEIRWRCDVAQGHYGNVDLKRIAKAKGGDYSIVNRRPRCRMSGCPGVVIFEDFARSWARQVETIQRPALNGGPKTTGAALSCRRSAIE